ncbi:MAG TPA: ATP-binding cassette domain-containing protein, partial [Candidatus Binataceae bacterium]
MAHQYIYTMKNLGKVHPPSREVLKGIWLSFFPGAKIGVLGANGAGKSSLLKIMSGVDKDFTGEAWPAEGIKVGLLPQEPKLDPAKDVVGNVEEGVSEIREMLARFEELGAKMAEPMGDEAMAKLMDEYGALQDRIETSGGWEVDRTVEIALDALRVPTDVPVERLSGGESRRVALCRLLLKKPDLLLLDEPTNHL